MDEVAKPTELIEQGNIIILRYPNFGGSGVEWDIVYNPIYDGPLTNYKNRKDVQIIYKSWQK